MVSRAIVIVVLIAMLFFNSAAFAWEIFPSLGEERLPYGGGRLDPYVARVLSQEPIDIQRSIIGILIILKSIAKSVGKE